MVYAAEGNLLYTFKKRIGLMSKNKLLFKVN